MSKFNAIARHACFRLDRRTYASTRLQTTRQHPLPRNCTVIPNPTNLNKNKNTDDVNTQHAGSVGQLVYLVSLTYTWIAPLLRKRWPTLFQGQGWGVTLGLHITHVISTLIWNHICKYCSRILIGFKYKPQSELKLMIAFSSININSWRVNCE